MLSPFLEKLRRSVHLSEEESYHCASAIFSGHCPQSEITELLKLMHQKGESVAEIVGFARSMREKATPVVLSKDAMDICGTGGTGKNRFNVSTSAAFVLASAGIPVAKHGNRGSRQANGSFDFLEELDILFDFGPEKISEIFAKTNLCFLFARNHHPAVKFVAPSRQEIGHRTIFNILGPLCNPAGIHYQLVGTTSEALAQKLAESLQKLGAKKALVIASHDGSDELSPNAPSTMFEVTPEKIAKSIFDPIVIGQPMPEETLSGLSAKENADLFNYLFSNRNTAHPISRYICLNAGACFYCFGKTESIVEGFELAQKHIKIGAVWKKFLQYQLESNTL